MLKTLGIIGGGQLGRMISFAAHQLGFKTVILTDQKNSPASYVTNHTIVADYSDKKALSEFANLCDVITFEFENIPFESAEILASLKSVYPNPEVLRVTQNRILEKNFLNKIGIRTTDYVKITNLQELTENLKKFGKAILKTANFGYDGKGQTILNNLTEAESTWLELTRNTTEKQFILEKFCPFDCEISVVATRSQTHEVECFEPLHNIHKNGILDKSIYPANVSKKIQDEARAIGTKIVQELDLIGLIAVEMFVVDSEILVNELAPRPHNSGHFSMDAAVTSQFEQLVRAVFGLPLGSTKFHSQGYMKNLIGNDVDNLSQWLKKSHAKLHLYGKTETKSGRKMGHVNVLETT